MRIWYLFYRCTKFSRNKVETQLNTVGCYWSYMARLVVGDIDCWNNGSQLASTWLGRGGGGGSGIRLLANDIFLEQQKVFLY